MNQDQRVRKLVNTAKKRLASILNQSGRVIYSSKATLKSGQLYILGLNPAGNEKKEFKHETIGKDLKKFPSNYLNAYIHERWGGRKEGTHKIQRRLKWLIEDKNALDLGSLENVCASNIVFVRSPNIAKLRGFDEGAKKCWEVHREIIRIVQPKVLLVFGNSASKSPFAYLLQQAKNDGKIIYAAKSCNSGHGSPCISCNFRWLFAASLNCKSSCSFFISKQLPLLWFRRPF